MPSRRSALLATGLLLGAGLCWILARQPRAPERPSPETHADAEVPAPVLLTRAWRPTETREQAPVNEQVPQAVGDALELVCEIVDSDGKPVAGAHLEIGPWRDAPTWGAPVEGERFLADPHGLVKVPLPASWQGTALWALAFEPTLGLATRSSEVFRPQGRKRLCVLPATVLVGRVLSPSPGHLPAGVRVEVSCDDWPCWPGLRVFSVDESGLFHVPGVQQEGVVLMATAPGHARSSAVIWNGQETAHSPIELTLGPPHSRRMRVPVVCSDGDPVSPGTPVLVREDDSAWAVERVDAEGNVWVDVSDDARRLELDVWGLRLQGGAWWSVPSHHGMPVAAVAAEPFVIQCGCNPLFELRTVDGTAVSKMQVGLRGAQEQTSGIRITLESDDHGRVQGASVVALLPGQYRLEAPGGQLLWSGELLAQRKVQTIPVRLDAMERILVRVLDPSGRVVRHTGVLVLEHLGPSGSFDGSKRWVGAASVGLRAQVPVSLWVPVGALSGARQPRLVFSIQQNARLVVEPLEGAARANGVYEITLPANHLGALEGSMLFPSGEAAAGVSVWLEGDGLPSQDLVTDDRGRFGHPWLLAGTYRLRARMGTVGREDEHEVEVRVGETAAPRIEYRPDR